MVAYVTDPANLPPQRPGVKWLEDEKLDLVAAVDKDPSFARVVEVARDGIASVNSSIGA